MITRTASTDSFDADHVADTLAAQLAPAPGQPPLAIVFLFADWRIDSARLAARLAPQVAPARVVGGTTIGVIGGGPNATAVALGLGGRDLRVGVGIADDLANHTLVRARDATEAAARALGTEAPALDSQHHVGITFVDGTCACEEMFCVGTSAPAPQIAMVGSCAATEMGSPRRAFVFADDRALADAGVVVVLDTHVPFQPIRSSHLVATDARTVVTESEGRLIRELDGKPALTRMRELVAALGDPAVTDADIRTHYAFARYIDNTPYVRSIVGVDRAARTLALKSGVEPGHVLRVMRPGDLVGTTRADLARTAERVGGQIGALLAFSCLGRHWEAAAMGLAGELADTYGGYGAIGCQSYGEQTGMLLVNHTLTGLALGGVTT